MKKIKAGRKKLSGLMMVLAVITVTTHNGKKANCKVMLTKS